jgi:hypothetical protein
MSLPKTYVSTLLAGSGKTVLAYVFCPPFPKDSSTNWDLHRSSLIDAMAENIDGKDITKGFPSEHIIDQNISSQDSAIAYYYCDFSDSKSLQTCNILGVIVRQLLEKIVIPDDLEEQIYCYYRHGTRTPTDSELVATLTSISKQFSKVFIFIDGLDECGKEEQSTILSMVHQLSQSRFPTVKVLITSREEAVISASLKGLPCLRISSENISLDISSFVEKTVKSIIRSGDLIIRDPSLESDIISALVDGAQGMWVFSSLLGLKLHRLMLLGFYGFISSFPISVKLHLILPLEKLFKTFQRVWQQLTQEYCRR